MYGLLTGIGQSDVDATILRQVNYANPSQDLLLVRITQVRILIDQIGHFILGEFLRFAEGLDVDRAGGNSLRYEEVLGTVDATF